MPLPPAICLPAILSLLAFATVVSQAEFVDVASRGTATQTSEWNRGQFPAALAIDGDPATFSHTDGTTANNAWTLRLDQEYVIARVELAMRADCCGGRLTGTTLRLIDQEGDSVYDQVITDPGPGSVAVFPVPPGTAVRQVRVSFENGATNPTTTTTNLHLGEVRVLAEIDLLPKITTFQAEPTEITAGQTSTLTWQTENADAVENIGMGPVTGTGAIPVSPSASKIFTLLVSNEHGSRSQSIGVIVDGALLAPRISEFMANNAHTVVRSDGATPDWIEIWNPNPAEIDLAGYRLTDDLQEPAKYIFPATLVPAQSYLLVDADTISRDSVSAIGFKLDKAADSYLALLDPSGQVLQSFRYPKQREDISYGQDWYGEEKFFLQPTPGEPAVTGTVVGFVEDTQFSIDRGFYSEPQSVVITSATPQAAIYYTTDGSAPSPDNPSASVYAEPVLITTTTVLRAAAFRAGYLPTDVDTQSYLFPGHVRAQSSTPAGFPAAWVPNLSGGVQAPVPALSHYGMDSGIVRSVPLVDRAGDRFDMTDVLLSIPAMSLVMKIDDLLDPVTGLHINARNRGRAWERAASLEFIDPATGTSTQANCGLRMHGGWNRYPEMLKKTFRFYFRDEYGDAKFKAPLFPDSVTDEFDRLLLRSGNGKAWPSPWRALAGPGNSLERNTYLRDQFLRDLQAEMGNDHVAGRFVHLYVNGHYWGLYNSVERPDEHMASSHFGGQDEDYDVIKWVRGTGHQMAAGTSEGWNELIALARRDARNPDVYEAIAERLDLPNFIDYMMLNFYAGNIDWVDSNAYALRNRANNGPVKFYCWDSEETFLSPGRDSTEQLVSDTSTELHHALRLNSEYRVLFGDRAQKHFFHEGALTQPRADATLMRRAWEIDRAIVGDSARWGNLLRPSDPYDRADWLAEIANLRDNYLGPRVATTLAQLRADGLFPNIDAPIFRPQRGGQVGTGFALKLSSAAGPNGTVYFTTDGSDPRLAGGAISPTAQASTPESGSLVIANDTLVRARTLSGSQWSALDEALYLIGDRASDLYVSEIMYHPASPLPGEAEFIELNNRGRTTHELRDLQITGGIQFDFSSAGIDELAPGARLVLGREQLAFAQAYPGALLDGVYGGALGNGGDSFSLEQDDGAVLWTLTYGDAAPWPDGTDGGGHSLTYAGGDQNLPASWRPSVKPGGSPRNSDAIAFGGGSLLAYAVAGIAVEVNAEGIPEFQISTRLGSDDALVSAEWSLDLQNWNTENLALVRQTPTGPGLANAIWRFAGAAPPQLFFRAVIGLRE